MVHILLENSLSTDTQTFEIIPMPDEGFVLLLIYSNAI